MTTATTPRTDDLTALDFDPTIPCEIGEGDDPAGDCGKAARWIARLRCTQCNARDALPLCTDHKGQMLDSDGYLVVGVCDGCGFTGAPLLDSLEPLR